MPNPIKNSISEFADNIIQAVLGEIYDGFYWVCEKEWNGMFSFLDEQIGNASTLLQKTPDKFSFTSYTIIKLIAENAVVPIATCFIACIFVWALVHLLQESNQMGGQIFEKLIVMLVMTLICTVMCAHSFDIVMFFFKLGTELTDKITDVTKLDVSFQGISLDAYLPSSPDRYTFRAVLELAGYVIILALANIAVMVLSIIIYMRCISWFLEFLIYACFSAIPFSTWMDKEWSQVGMNYTRKMLAISFQGPIMLLIFALYGFILKSSNLNLGNGNFFQSLLMIVGCGYALVMLMQKVGNISESIFNAH